MPPIEDHPLRYKLANELHARPFPGLEAPCTAVYVAIKQPSEAVSRDRAEDLAHLTKLLDRYGVSHPPPGATHYSGEVGRYTLKWESHTEFVTYTAVFDGVSERPFDPADFSVFPEEWLAEAPGQRVTSVVVRVEAAEDEDRIDRVLGEWFVPESLACARVLEDSAVAAGDFRIDTAGHMRFALFAKPGLGRRRMGRIVQRLCEIETYKSMSMLGFSRAHSLSPRLTEIDNNLTVLMGEMTAGTISAEDTLPQLLAISTELETMSAKASFRFGATGAYEAIVTQRISALREVRFRGRQTFQEFMMRRYEPAMRTVKATERRLTVLADRAIRAGDLLRTRVDVERSAQNQELLASMDRRADMQLRLQRTVEGLSVVAISYYAVSLAAYLLYPVGEATGLSIGLLTAIVTLPVVGAVWWAIRRIRRQIE